MCRKNKRKKTQQKVTPPKRCLESCMEKFNVECDRCHEPLIVHGYRQKSHNFKEKIYAACHNKAGLCPKAGFEICFIEKFF
jgi:hypothetical protein